MTKEFLATKCPTAVLAACKMRKVLVRKARRLVRRLNVKVEKCKDNATCQSEAKKNYDALKLK